MMKIRLLAERDAATRGARLLCALLLLRWTAAPGAGAADLDHEKLLRAQTFWDNQDWDWYLENIPFFESPDPDLDTTYYYRWEVVTKHRTYGSPSSGFSFTEFIDRPFWSGAYGAISCPAGHQLYEVRWLHDERHAWDYAAYWLRTPGAQPRNYSTWLADAIWAVHRVHPDPELLKGLLDGLIANYTGWEVSHFVPEIGMFWQTGHDDGMEININSRQTRDTVRGAPGFRPTLNSYLHADALAIARIARLAGREETARTFEGKAAELKERVQSQLWDPRRQFFLQRYKNDEERDGQKIKAYSLTHETGKFAGSPHGREEIGYVPWQFNLPDPGYEAAWKFLMDPGFFASPFGPRTVEKNDPMYELSTGCCWWSGQSWPYATTQTLVALANLLNNYSQMEVTRADYVKLLQTYARTHRKNGKPYIAEAAHPETGSWEGHDSYNHSEHYFHSGFTDLVITGLAGIRPRDDGVLEVNPLAPEDWPYFGLDNVLYRGRKIGVLWDRAGTRYGRGPGLFVTVDGQLAAHSARLERLTAQLPPEGPRPPRPAERAVNFAVNNDGRQFPELLATYTSPSSSLTHANDGHFWYHQAPPNRWTTEGSTADRDAIGVDFGISRKIHTLTLCLLGGEAGVEVPEKVEVEIWRENAWVPLALSSRRPEALQGRRANHFHFAPVETSRLRVWLTRKPGKATGLSELEVWGDAKLPIEPAPPPRGNLAYNPGGAPYPRASASYTSRFDRVERVNDGLVFHGPTPNNRWTAYESPNDSDWLEIDFGEPRTVGRLELHLYDDRGGVQAPESYSVELWDGSAWKPVQGASKSPEAPRGRQKNTVRFQPVSASKVRVVFQHRGKARPGVTELEVWGG